MIRTGSISLEPVPLSFYQSVQYLQQLFLPVIVFAKRGPVGVLSASYPGAEVRQPPRLFFQRTAARVFTGRWVAQDDLTALPVDGRQACLLRAQFDAHLIEQVLH